MNRPVVAHAFDAHDYGLVVLRPSGTDDRMTIAATLTDAGHRTEWHRLWRGYVINGGTWPDVEALLTHHGIHVEPLRPLRTSGAR